MAVEQPSIRELLGELVQEVTLLLRQEIRLLKAEGSEKMSQIQGGAMSILSGLLLGFAALLILLQALVIGLANVMPAWLAAIVVGGVIALVALALIAAGKRNLEPGNLTPERTIKSFRDTGRIMRESVR